MGNNSKSRSVMKFLLMVMFTLIVNAHLAAIDNKEAKEIETTAYEAYELKKYDVAISEFEKLINSGYKSPSLYHNLGLSYFQNQNIAKAILYLERAKRLQPLNSEIEHNLKIVREDVNSEISVLPDFFLKNWYFNVVRIASPIVWIIFHALFLFGALVLFYLYLIKGLTFGLHRSYIIGLTIGLLVLSLVFMSFSYSRNYSINRDDVAIVINENTTLRLGAEDNSKEVEKINAGVKVFILDQINDYLKIKLEDGTEAWVKNTEIERI